MPTAVPIISAATGVIGLANSIQQQRERRSMEDRGMVAAERAQANQDESHRALLDLFNRKLDVVKGLQARGAYDPQAALNQLHRDMGLAQQDALANTAVALRGAGFRPGDSTVTDTVDRATSKYVLDRSRLDNQIREAAPRQQLVDLGMVGGGELVGDQGAQVGAGQLGLQTAAAAQQIHPVADPTQFFGWLNDYVNRQQQKRTGAVPNVNDLYPLNRPDQSYDLVV